MNAIKAAECGMPPFYQWSDGTFLYNGGDGNHAAVAFHNQLVVATLFDHESDRSPFASEGQFSCNEILLGPPVSHTGLLDRCLSYWCTDMQGKSVPLITAAFWNRGQQLVAGEPWSVMWKHGGWIMSRQLIEDLDEALAEWKADLNLTDDQLALARSLLQRRMDERQGVINLELADLGMLLSALPQDPLSELLQAAGGGQQAVRAGLDALASLGIRIPESILKGDSRIQ
jgi:hypothetical protein